MQFAKVQGAGLVALGLLLLLLQAYLLFHSAGAPASSTEAAPIATPAEHTFTYLPGIIGMVALGLGAVLVVVQNRRGRNEEVQPKRTPSGLPM
jgi:TRAP-type C4-dicarboxylate transport system permease small subunit